MQQLYNHQAHQLESGRAKPKMALFWSPRLGKTLATVEELKWNNPERGLVVAPLVVCPFWGQELALGGFQTVPLYVGTIAEAKATVGAKNDGIYIVNYDRLAPLVEDLIRWGPTALIGDESHLIKSPSAKRARAFRRLAWRADWVRLLTGTPSPNHYGDLWGQLSALDPETWGKSYEKFARQYLIRDHMFPSKVVGTRNVPELHAKMLPYVSIVRREDVFGPDSWQYIERVVDLPPAARKLYDQLGRDWMLDESGLIVSADHILKRMTRLQQLAAGYLPSDDGVICHVHDAKVTAVMADLEEILEQGEKAVIFHRFRWEGEHYAEGVERYGITPYIINGDTPSAEREAAVSGLREHSGAAVAIVQLQSGGVGISFAEATHALFVSRGFSYADDQQARDRIYKPEARRVVAYYSARRTVDEYVARVLAAKGSVNESVRNADIESIIWGG